MSAPELPFSTASSCEDSRRGATVEAALYGPFPSRAAVSCDGKPVWTGSIPVAGDGAYRTDAFTPTATGFYTYREWILATGFVRPATTRCGEAAETTVVQAQPEVETVVSAEVVRPGASLADRIRVRGLGPTQATIRVELFGPFASREGMSCDGAPVSTDVVTTKGDGDLVSPRVALDRPGFYTYRERLLPSAASAGVTTACGLTAETALVAPRILTGRGDPARRAPARRAAETRPTRVRVGRLGIDATVVPVAIDLASGALGTPPDVASGAGGPTARLLERARARFSSSVTSTSHARDAARSSRSAARGAATGWSWRPRRVAPSRIASSRCGSTARTRCRRACTPVADPRASSSSRAADPSMQPRAATATTSS